MSDPTAEDGAPHGDPDRSQIPDEQRAHGDDPAPEPRGRRFLRELAGGTAAVSILSIVVGLLVGAVFIAIFNTNGTIGYFFAAPGPTFAAIGETYAALVTGGLFDPSRAAGAYVPDGVGPLAPVIRFFEVLSPFSDTLRNATPLIAAGLGVALGFRTGLFNIGGRGQIIIGAILGGAIAFHLPAPGIVKLVLAGLLCIVGGAIWGGIVGLLRAVSGAHEVITTIMLNYVAFWLLDLLLRTPLLQAPRTVNPQSPPIPDDAALPYLIPGSPSWIVDWGFVLVVLATLVTAWLLNRSSLGMRFRAVGENPNAARVAGMDVKRALFLSMLIAGALAGLAAFTLLFSAEDHQQGISPSFDAARVGFDAITVALLGRSRPWGVFAAGLLFGALRAGSFDMQAYVPIDLVSVIQSVIVLLIAAPPLVRTMFRLPAPTGFRLRQRSITKAVISR